jgi:hypothetical protein
MMPYQSIALINDKLMDFDKLCSSDDSITYKFL